MRDPYVYEDYDCLINKVQLKDKLKLDEFENRMTTLALVSIFKKNIEITSSKDVFMIHKMIFENVYDWAGEQRIIDMTKNEPVLGGLSVEYSHHKNINNDLDTVDKKYFNQNWSKLSKEDFVHLFTRMIANIWQIHAFREGNTRTVSAYAFLFLKQQGYHYNVEFIKANAKYFRTALVMASIKEYSEFNYLQKIIWDAISQNSSSKKSNYSKINDYNVETYEYEYHKMKEE